MVNYLDAWFYALLKQVCRKPKLFTKHPWLLSSVVLVLKSMVTYFSFVDITSSWVSYIAPYVYVVRSAKDLRGVKCKFLDLPQLWLYPFYDSPPYFPATLVLPNSVFFNKEDSNFLLVQPQYAMLWSVFLSSFCLLVVTLPCL